MTALAAARRLSVESWTYKEFTLSSGEIAYQGGIAALDITTGEVVAGAVSTSLVTIGTFAETVDASAAAGTVNVRLAREINVVWFANSGVDPVSATDVGRTVYVEDDQTVSATDGTGTRSAAGRMWAFDSTRGVAVQIDI